MSVLVEIPAASVPAAIARALCDGSGLITIPTADGPEHAACLGCSSCRRADAERVTAVAQSPAVRASRLADVFAAAADDEAF